MKPRPPRSVALVALVFAVAANLGRTEDRDPWRSPFEVAYSPDGASIAVTDRTAHELVIVDEATVAPRVRIAFEGEPTGVTWTGPSCVLVAVHGVGQVAEVDATDGTVRRRIPVGLRPVGIAVAPRRGLLVAANTVTDDVSIVDLARGEERARVRVAREPWYVAVTPDETLAVVGNLLPAGSAADPELAAVVSLIDLERLAFAAEVKLPPGSTSVRDVAVSPDGRWAWVVHALGRFNVPATQIDRGWVNTNALSRIDLACHALDVTVLLDQVFSGSTNPWGVALSRDGTELWIALHGVREVARVDVGELARRLDSATPASLAPREAYAASRTDVWTSLREGSTSRASLANDLTALHGAGLIDLFPAGGIGPVGVDLSPDGAHVAVALQYCGEVAVFDARTGRCTARIALGPAREPDRVRRGEIAFHDATLSFQRWLSCSTCHPDNGRTDGLRWDLLNDGLGTPQRTRSLLLSHRLERTTARGVRGGLRESVAKGLFFILHEPDEALVDDLVAYLESLEPEPSPWLVDGALSPAAVRGREIFAGKGQCTRCHEGDLGIDQKAHDVGTRGEFDPPDDEYYTPKLVELWRTAPFLHDGRAATLRDIFTVHDAAGRHGKASLLTPAELDDLAEYLRSR